MYFMNLLQTSQKSASKRFHYDIKFKLNSLGKHPKDLNSCTVPEHVVYCFLTMGAISDLTF